MDTFALSLIAAEFAFPIFVIAVILALIIRKIVNFDNIGILGRTGLESSATSTYNSRFVIIGMYTLFHCRLPRCLFGLPHAY